MADYADIEVTSSTWSDPVEITEAQVWICVRGGVSLTTKAVPGGTRGIPLFAGSPLAGYAAHGVPL